MAWTSISTGVFAVEAPVLGSTELAIYNNLTALANGDSGAPQVQTAAIADGSVTSAKLGALAVSNVHIAAGTIEETKLVATQAMANWVSTRMGSATTDELGMLVFAKYATNQVIDYGDLVAGNLLEPANTNGDTAGSNFASTRTYKCLGYISTQDDVTLWQRVT